MTILLTQSLMKQIYPGASSAIINAFVEKQAVMKDILFSANRAAICFGNLFVEVRGFAIPGLTEEINRYTAANVVTNWPGRYSTVAQVQKHFGTSPGWQKGLFDEIYGDRMGNRPGTSDGSKYIGRGGPQITGLDGYQEMTKRIGQDFVNNPGAITAPDIQPALVAAFWAWKGMNDEADANNITAVRKLWNGGAIGLPDVRKQVARILKIITAYLATPTAAMNVVVSNTAVDDVLKGYQQALIDLGYHDVGDPDGRMGGKTRGAITAFYNDRHVMGQPIADAGLAAELANANAEGWHRPIAPDRAYATAAELAPKVPAVQAAQSAGLWAKITGGFGAVGAAGNGVMKFMPDAHDQSYPYVSMAQEWFTSIPGWAYGLVICGVAYAIYRQTTKSQAATVADYQTGKLN